MTKRWKLVSRVMTLKSPWLTLYADKFTKDTGEGVSEYWHVQRADSVIVLAVQDGHFILPATQYRPGIDDVTLDFAGTRLAAGEAPADAALRVMWDELGVAAAHVVSLKKITEQPLYVDSAFSSQLLHGYVAEIRPDAKTAPHVITHSLNKIEQLRQKLQCLQCRGLLDEFMIQWQKELLS